MLTALEAAQADWDALQASCASSGRTVNAQVQHCLVQESRCLLTLTAAQQTLNASWAEPRIA